MTIKWPNCHFEVTFNQSADFCSTGSQNEASLMRDISMACSWENLDGRIIRTDKRMWTRIWDDKVHYFYSVTKIWTILTAIWPRGKPSSCRRPLDSENRGRLSIDRSLHSPTRLNFKSWSIWSWKILLEKL